MQTVVEMLADDHFSVDGTLIEAAASMRSFRRRDDDDDPRGDGGVQTLRTSSLSAGSSTSHRMLPRGRGGLR